MGFSYAGESGKGNYGNGNARNSYSYSRSLSSGPGYSLAMPKSYGTDVDLKSYLGRSRLGLAGYVNNLLKYSVGNVRANYLYPAQKKQELYKVEKVMRNYELKILGGGKPGAMVPNVPMYDLSSARVPVSNLEKRLNLN
jgi:hypothetical protein